MKFCPNCGDPIEATEKHFCDNCGTKLRPREDSHSRTSAAAEKQAAPWDHPDVDEARERARRKTTEKLEEEARSKARVLQALGGLFFLYIAAHIMAEFTYVGFLLLLAIVFYYYYNHSQKDPEHSPSIPNFTLEEAWVLELRDVVGGGSGSSSAWTRHFAKLDLRDSGRKEFRLSAELRETLLKGDLGIAALPRNGKELLHFENLLDYEDSPKPDSEQANSEIGTKSSANHHNQNVGDS